MKQVKCLIDWCGLCRVCCCCCCRFYRFSSMTTDDDKRRDAINNIRFYYAHVFNGVSFIGANELNSTSDNNTRFSFYWWRRRRFQCFSNKRWLTLLLIMIIGNYWPFIVALFCASRIDMQSHQRTNSQLSSFYFVVVHVHADRQK